LAWFLIGRQKPAVAPAVTLAAPTPQQEEMVEIIITTQSIQRGAVFTEDVLTTLKYPKKDVVEGTFITAPDEVIGKRAKIDLEAGIPVTRGHLVIGGEGSMASFQIPKGLVAISIPTKDRLANVSFAPQSGDHVNIITTLQLVDLDTNFQSKLPDYTSSVVAPLAGNVDRAAELTAKISSGGPTAVQGRAELDPTLNQPVYLIPSETQRPRLVSQTLLQDVIVLQVGNFKTNQQSQSTSAQPTATATPGTGQPQQQTTVVAPLQDGQPDVITLLVTPQDAVTLNYLIVSGARMTLVLRGAGDDGRVQTEAVTLQYLMEQYKIPLPAKLPYGFEPRMDTITVPSPYTVVTATPVPAK
jgi:pilus assembly protein CpaB